MSKPGNSKTFEDEGEFVELYDCKTGGIICCGTRSHFQNAVWLGERQLTNDQLFDVIQYKPFLENRKDTITFDRDETMRSTQEIGKHMRLLVDLVCMMYTVLDRTKAKKIIGIFCKNGRSRSPCIILAYYMLVGGCSREKAMKFIQKAFHSQRPTVAAKYSEFPNYTKFINLMCVFENVIQQTHHDHTKTWLFERIFENCSFINMILKKSDKKPYDAVSFFKKIIGFQKDKSTRMRLSNNFLHPTSYLANLSYEYSSNSSESSSQRKSARDRTVSTKLTKTNILPELVVGRRVRSLWNAGRFKNSNLRWYLGTLVKCTGNNSWLVKYDNGIVENETLERIVIAFQSGTAVSVHFSSSRSKSGAIINSNGLLSYIVRLDDDGRIYEVKNDDIDLLYPYIHDDITHGITEGSIQNRKFENGKKEKTAINRKHRSLLKRNIAQSDNVRKRFKKKR